MGKLFVVSGPSGAGKSTLTKKLVNEVATLELTTSATTREARSGEVDKVDYYFLKKDEFLKGIEDEKFLEYANVHENYYGTLKSEVERRLSSGANVLLEIDVQGGEQIKEKFRDAVLIFIVAPDEKELERRLRGRGTDSDEVIELRLKNSLRELKYKEKYDIVVVNDDFDRALSELGLIIKNGGKNNDWNII